MEPEHEDTVVLPIWKCYLKMSLQALPVILLHLVLSSCVVGSGVPKQQELFLDDGAESPKSPSATLAQFLNSAWRSVKDRLLHC